MKLVASSDAIKIDSHQHFWLRERGDYTWLTAELDAIYDDFLPEHLVKTLQRNGIQKTVLVQAAETDAETDFMLSLAQSNTFIAAVVGWVDLESENASDRIAQCAQNQYFKGIRPMIQSIACDDWMLMPTLDKHYRLLAKLGLCFDALVKPQHLTNLCTLASRHPDLKIVIDHAAKPDLTSSDISRWKKGITDIASHKNVHCKISGLLTEAPAGSAFETFHPVLDHLFESFGAKRLMWGSDWPVINLAGTYDAWVQGSKAYMSQLSQDEANWVWAKTAQDFYNI